MLYKQTFLPVTGRSTVQKTFDRLPVQELEADHPYQWSLFILGWAYIKGTPIPFPGVVQPKLRADTSHMEMGGIHGKPYQEWLGDRRTGEEAQVDFSYKDKKDMNPSPPRFGGYCHHAAITFPTWHRPYVMLIEQTIGEYAENIAQQIEHSHPGEVGLWVDAAKQLRFPYWDWADPKVDTEGLPSFFYTNELTIMGMGRKTLTVPNPLASFTFPFIPKDFVDQQSAAAANGLTAYFTKWNKTFRYAKSSPDAHESDIPALQAALKQQAESVRTTIGTLFTFADTTTGDPAIMYDEFSNTQNQSRQDGNHNNTNSVEGVHNVMHFVLGQNGHMGYTDYAAFDPIFFFHHANIDRLTALWDWCYPQYWMGTGYTIDGNKNQWTLVQGTYSAAYSEKIEQDGEWGSLVPFRHPNGTYWTPKDVRFLTPDAFPKYYSYKEFLGVKVDKAAASLKERQEARARIAKYYGVNPQKDVATLHSPSWAPVTVPSGAEADLPADFQPIKNFRMFKVLVRLVEHAVGGPYNFHLYYKNELVGTVSVFARETGSPCGACAIRREAGSIVRGVISIPTRIIDEILLHNSIHVSQNSLDAVTELIAHSLTAKLEDSHGNVLAVAEDGKDVKVVQAEHAAPRTIHPAEVALQSHAVAEHVKDKNQPVHFFHHMHHRNLFRGLWRVHPRAVGHTEHH